MFGTSLSQRLRFLFAIVLVAAFCATAVPVLADEPTTADTIPTIYSDSYSVTVKGLSLIHISEPTRPFTLSRMPSSA